MPTYKTPDWREALRRNRNKSNIVILGYLFIYSGIGFLLDLLYFFYFWRFAMPLKLPAIFDPAANASFSHFLSTVTRFVI